jgi:alpha-tubulin suppressor-like RCC1 family protein
VLECPRRRWLAKLRGVLLLGGMIGASTGSGSQGCCGGPGPAQTQDAAAPTPCATNADCSGSKFCQAPANTAGYCRNDNVPAAAGACNQCAKGDACLVNAEGGDGTGCFQSSVGPCLSDRAEGTWNAEHVGSVCLQRFAFPEVSCTSTSCAPQVGWKDSVYSAEQLTSGEEFCWFDPDTLSAGACAQAAGAFSVNGVGFAIASGQPGCTVNTDGEATGCPAGWACESDFYSPGPFALGYWCDLTTAVPCGSDPAVCPQGQVCSSADGTPTNAVCVPLATCGPSTGCAPSEGDSYSCAYMDPMTGDKLGTCVLGKPPNPPSPPPPIEEDAAVRQLIPLDVGDGSSTDVQSDSTQGDSTLADAAMASDSDSEAPTLNDVSTLAAGDGGFLAGATAISAAGDEHACALLLGGTVACWGSNQSGQLGNGTTTNSPIPVVVSNLSGVTAISAGMASTCAVLSGGSVACWGSNLGNGTMTNSSTPVAVPSLNDVTAIAAGGFSCAVLSGGTAACWGYNANGELGDGTTVSSLTPVAVSNLTGVTSIALGTASTYALLSDGTVASWGDNMVGELGNGPASAPFLSPGMVPNLAGVTAIAGGAGDTRGTVSTPCVVLSGGTVDCWGDNEYGELGSQISVFSDSSNPVVEPSLTGATGIGSGDDNACAVLSGGTVECWGAGGSGELGNGTTTSSRTPVTVLNLSDATAVSTGGNFSCALLSGGTVECWGLNFLGQLGNGTTTNSSHPVRVLAVSP